VRRLFAIASCVFLALALGLGNPALRAQVSTIIQSGPWGVSHLGCYVGQGSAQAVMTDCGPAGGQNGPGVSEYLQITMGPPGEAPYADAGSGPYATGHCQYDAPVTNMTGYHYLCLDPNAQGGGLLAYGSAGETGPLPFNCIINGVLYPNCFSGGGGGWQPVIRVITSGASDTASTSDITIAWDSADAAPKAETVPGCTLALKAKLYVFKDEIASAQVYPITVTPTTGTIDGEMNYTLYTNLSSMTMQCDGIGNYVVE
jgi:hypothetical protein